ncbi:MAG: hypothetical protein KDD11_12825 [Acidobacteria bacterium]|nr:hypothetical protein [Acidobacteriota bacterium]
MRSREARSDALAVVRTLAEVLFAASASLALAFRTSPSKLAPAAADPLRSTLVVVPIVALALVWIDRACAARGGRRLAPALRRAHLAAMLGLSVLTLGRGALGLELSAPVVAAGWALLLAHRVYHQTLTLRPLLGRRLPERPSTLFFFLPLVVYLAITPWMSAQRPPDGDEPYYLLLAHSLSHDLDADLANNYAEEDWRTFMDRPIAPQPGDPTGPDGEVYSRHNEMLPLLLAPGYRLAGRSGAVMTLAAMAALLAWLFLRLGRSYFPDSPGAVLLATSLVAFAPPLLLYAVEIWTEVPGAVLATIALDRALVLRRREPRRWEVLLGIGLPVALLPLLKLRFVLIGLPILVLAWWRAPRARRQLVALGVILALLGLGFLVSNQVRFGNPLKMHSSEELDLAHHSLGEFARGGVGLFFDSAFGLFAVAPLWLVVLPGLAWVATRRQTLLADLGLLSLPYLALLAPRGEWYGGWSPPFRYGLVLLPLLGLLAVPAFEHRRSRGARALLSALALVTLVLTLAWVAVPGWTFAFADGKTYLLDHLSRITGSDVVRIFPSTIRPRLATWLWPPLLAALLIAGWWWPRSRRGRRSLGPPRATGTALLLAGAALIPLAGARWPSHVIEIEDAQVGHYGGHLHPSRWTVDRARYRGGWVLRPGESATLPVVAGGDRVAVTIHAQWVSNGGEVLLELRRGEHLLATWRPQEERRWLVHETEPMPWTPGEPLVLALRAVEPGTKPTAAAPSGLVIDRVELSWSAEVSSERADP